MKYVVSCHHSKTNKKYLKQEVLLQRDKFIISKFGTTLEQSGFTVSDLVCL